MFVRLYLTGNRVYVGHMKSIYAAVSAKYYGGIFLKWRNGKGDGPRYISDLADVCTIPLLNVTEMNIS